MVGILGKKIGMTELFDENGELIPVTVVEAGPCPVVQVKTKDRDGYEAIQVGFGDLRPQRVNRPLKGIFDKAGVSPKKVLHEFRTESDEAYEVGQVIEVSAFQAGDQVHVTGTSKGKGFQGVVKRHHFHGGPKTHGQSDRHRAPGSIGASSYPSRVFKGMRMAGRMGNKRVTVKNLHVVEADSERNVLLIQGAVPGPKGGLLIIRKRA